MSAPVYATGADLAAWLQGDPPTNADRVLRAADGQVREATAIAFYLTDATTGLPTDANLLAAFKEATCIQAAALLAAEIDPDAGGVVDAAVESSAGIGSARTTLAGAEQAAAARARLAHGLCPAASRTLRLAGLRPQVWQAG